MKARVNVKSFFRCFSVLFVVLVFTFQISAPLKSNLAEEMRIIHVEDSMMKIVLIGDRSYQVSFDGVTFSRELSQSRFIRFKDKIFDPLKENYQSSLPPVLRSVEDGDGESLYIVQFYTQAFEEYQDQINRLGGVVLVPFPEYALIVKMNGDTKRAVEKLPTVRWIGPYHAAYKIEGGIARTILSDSPESKRYSVLVFRSEQQGSVVQFITKIDGEINLKTESNRFEATLNSDQLRQVIQLNEVQYVDHWTPQEDDMDIAREISGASFVEAVAGYTGQGVRGEVLDDGLRVTHVDFQKNTPLIRYNDEDNNHGTPVYSIVFSSGTGDPTARGVIPDAERPIFSSRYHMVDRYAHTKELVDPRGPYKALFQTNSWGNSRTTEYTTISAEMDTIIFDLDILITQSQSNAKDRMSRPQAWAKNIVSVGGVRHLDTLTRDDDAWDVPGKSGSSIGPASDGRIKPDVWHFYDYVRTANYDGDASYRDFGGTSAATPIVAGYCGVIFQMWADGVFHGRPGKKREAFRCRPHPTTVKALMIHSAYQYPFSGQDHDKTRMHQGWGMPDVKNLYETAKNHFWRLPVLVDETRILKPLKTHTYYVFTKGNRPLKATLVYADPPGVPAAAYHRINDISLKLTRYDGVYYWGNNGLLEGVWSAPGGESNKIDTVENVFIEDPGFGIWKIEVIGDEIVQDSHVETKAIDADYALVVTGGIRLSPDDDEDDDYDDDYEDDYEELF